MSQLLLLLSILSPATGSARGREIDGLPEPRPPIHRCRPNEENSCRAVHCPAAESARAAVIELDRELRAIDEKIAPRAFRIADHESFIPSLRTNLKLLSDELDFLKHQRAVAPSPELLPGLVTLDRYFPRHPLRKSWRERNPDSRRERLQNHRERITRDLQQNLQQIAEIRKDLQSDLDLRNARQAQKNTAAAADEQHSIMCRSGCHERSCTPDN